MRTEGSLQALACLAALALAASGLPFAKRASIDHDAVVGFPETVPSGVTGDLYLKYKPYLKVFNGCVPFPAVQENGDTKCVPRNASISARHEFGLLMLS